MNPAGIYLKSKYCMYLLIFKCVTLQFPFPLPNQPSCLHIFPLFLPQKSVDLFLEVIGIRTGRILNYLIKCYFRLTIFSNERHPQIISPFLLVLLLLFYILEKSK